MAASLKYCNCKHDRNDFLLDFTFLRNRDSGLHHNDLHHGVKQGNFDLDHTNSVTSFPGLSGT